MSQTPTGKPENALAARKIYDLRGPPTPTTHESFLPSSSYNPQAPIAIDFGTSQIRAGYTTTSDPSLMFPTVLTKWRDRKISKTFTFIGNDVHLDNSIRTQAKSPFDGPLISNWEYVEQILDYTFKHLGVASQNSVDNPVVMSEKAGTSLLQRKGFSELLYETYGVDKIAFGIDDLFSYYQNGGKDGIVIGSGFESTHLIPVINGKGMITEAKRVNWGGRQARDYMGNLLALKYPYFPTKINSYQSENLIKDWCYLSKEYETELAKSLDLQYLENFDITVEAPFTEIEKVQKSEEELARQAEKRKESGRRLQEQAQQKRLEKLVQKEQEFEYFGKIRERLPTMTKKAQQQLLKEENFDDEADFNKYLASLEASLKRARKQDIGESSDDPSSEVPSFPLIDIPDDQLTEDAIKEKRKQKLMKANYDARLRAKAEKQAEQERIAEEERKDSEWRKTNLQGWIHDRRTKLKDIVNKRKERAKLREQLNDRKSHAAQLRMKSIASLAAEDSGSGGKRRRNATIDNDPNDTFGTNDEDWAIYKDIATLDDEEMLEEEEAELVKLERELLEYDPHFTEEDTYEASYDWRKSTLHLFLRGPRPFDSEDEHQQHQMHLNVERIRVPEVVWQPSIAGIDSAGIGEILENLLNNSLSATQRDTVVNDIFTTGGFTSFANYEDRIRSELRAILPFGAEINVRGANDKLLDSWRGMSKWAQTQSSTKDNGYVTRREYDECGVGYLKEHGLSNLNIA